MPKSGTNVSIPTKLLATGVALALTLVVCATAATVIVSTDMALKGEAVTAEPNIVLIEHESFRDRGSTAALIDSLLAPLGLLGPARESDVESMTALAAPARSMSADTASAWLPVYRRWARSKPLPALWGYRAGIPGVHHIDELPSRNYSAIRTLFDLNERTAFFELQSGDARSAMERGRENLAASRHLIEQPLLIDALVGRILARRATQLLTMAATRAGDSSVARQSARLDSIASHDDARSLMPWILQAESNPHSTAAENVAANRALHPAVRVEALNSIVFGGCRNVREVMFGFSSARNGALQRSATALSDISRGAELATLFANQFDAIANDATSGMPVARSSRTTRLAALGPMEWIVPPGIRARVTLCTAFGY